ncbi:YHS domain-containing protein [Labrenzia sp. MBR-25]
MKLKFALPTLAAALVLSTAALAADEYNVANGLTLNGNPLGMHGIDPVSMFAGKTPGAGDAVHTSSHDGVDYYFATAETKEQFDAAPESFLPQFGGFCAFGIYVGKKLDGDVRFADIVDGKLYLFVNAVIFDKYLQQKDEVLAGAYAKWPEIRETAISDL